MSHVVPIDTKQRCAGCGGTIPPGAMHTVTRSQVGSFETICYHEQHCPTCDFRRKADKKKASEA
jgi:hypothetical protein